MGRGGWGAMGLLAPSGQPVPSSLRAKYWGIKGQSQLCRPQWSPSLTTHPYPPPRLKPPSSFSL